MDKESLKKAIKPIIKECLKEFLLEEGLMKLVKENLTVESKQTQSVSYQEKEKKFIQKNTVENKKENLKEVKQKLLKEISMTGFDPFYGSEPLPEDSSNQFHEEGVQESRLMAGIQGSGVDISRLMSANKQAWNFYNNALTKGEKE